jgi:hypothetical protein
MVQGYIVEHNTVAERSALAQQRALHYQKALWTNLPQPRKPPPIAC